MYNIDTVCRSMLDGILECHPLPSHIAYAIQNIVCISNVVFYDIGANIHIYHK